MGETAGRVDMILVAVTRVLSSFKESTAAVATILSV